jgi:uncharacterized protein YqeY
MRRGLTAAMKARDKPATAALRSTPAAIDNAEAELLNGYLDGGAELDQGA